jgi:hypothetical protein
VKLTTQCPPSATVKNEWSYTASALQVFREWTQKTLSFTSYKEFHSQMKIKAKSADRNSVMSLNTLNTNRLTKFVNISCIVFLPNQMKDMENKVKSYLCHQENYGFS